MQKVTEFVVLEDIYKSVVLRGFLIFLGDMLHHTKETIGLILFFSIGYAEIKKGWELIWELGELNEDVLLCPYF